ncbi:hypothetical protein [uncultured Treponema sp.]|uniref:hypothetical protein n=1 Tax=uncultured Treponema sp. TaxID=162155 RepID=UPI0028041D6E|nr:hypothetical protein [uncultured Treponema sp.]
MSEKQILINCGKNWFVFSKSRTRQLDYCGKVENPSRLNVENYQKLASSAYFSPETDVSDKDSFDFLLHVGAMLCAVEARDSLLAGELYLRRKKSFDKFARLTQFIIEPVSAEILFSLLFGRMYNIEENEIPLVLAAAKKKLSYICESETLKQAFVRYFKENKVCLTLPVVGMNYHRWSPYSDFLDGLAENLRVEDLLVQAEKIRKARHDFYSSLEVAVQAEPYNPADENAVAVMAESIDAKIAGNPGLEKAGYVRATAAKIIRAAKPEKMSFKAQLMRIDCRNVVLKIEL